MNDGRERSGRVDVSLLAGYRDRIDVRSPREFADDHLPGATNHPVLDDGERTHVGSLYAASAFDGRRRGAALVARNIATMLETAFAPHGRDWRPLVYCWRGGQRSRSLAHILNEIGWRAVALDGGYRAYRRHVVAALDSLPCRLEFVVLCGLTGSGKSRLLGALGQAGAQTLDLEGLARHRGSLLGDIPDDPQPSQKRFESGILAQLEMLDPARPVFVESESRRVGVLQVPTILLERMHAGRAVELRTARALRVALLHEDYPHLRADPETLRNRLERLTVLHGKATLARWHAVALRGDWDALVGELLEKHYDPAYRRSLERNFAPSHAALQIDVDAISREAFAALAERVLEIASIPAAAHAS